MIHLDCAEDRLRKHTRAELGNEIAFFHRHKQEWIAEHHGEFVVLGKQTFGGFHRTYSAALQAGIRMFGPVTPFLIEQII
jgi:hypothetical protein